MTASGALAPRCSALLGVPGLFDGAGTDAGMLSIFANPANPLEETYDNL